MVSLKKQIKHLKMKLILQKNVKINITGAYKMNDLNKYIKKQLKNKEFKEEWEKSEIEYQIVHALIDAREKNNYTQQQLAALTGINQADISKLENGRANPSIKTLQRLAKGLNMHLKVELVPNK